MAEPKPEIRFKTPVALELQPGTDWFCRYGKSQDQVTAPTARKGFSALWSSPSSASSGSSCVAVSTPHLTATKRT